ncbi:ABC transporter ATP-binding protein [Paenibacillus hemerocallicola]|uniref:ABC transporter ATP-binding protein n=1 Tax=Paenibacillus hemerocallicola TaxID=1172614 RepID=A0A5C4TDP8_9BACL|nr:ABC transporter ATP-binding protein [Paenibacillus hemerocallicola]TNJ66972.1 ABC transporter ATP-binding protein [Paenibacillus hemerocallicola]
MGAILEVRELQTVFGSGKREVVAVDRISLDLAQGEIVALVGESGCGKSAASLSIMQLLSGSGRIRQGEVRLGGTDLTKLPERELRKRRGNELAMVFQEPLHALNPVLSIGAQFTEGLRRHLGQGRKEAARYAEELLKRVNIARAREIMRSYPHMLSGGMRQRVMIAMAMACEPQVLIADEPTTALDVTIQEQILLLLRELQHKGTAIMLITHDLGVVADMADRVLVMYAGQIVEQADVFELFRAPLHPYTQGLLRSVPEVIPGRDSSQLEAIPGAVPALSHLPTGCRFHPRCPLASERCRIEEPELQRGTDGHAVRCHAVDMAGYAALKGEQR